MMKHIINSAVFLSFIFVLTQQVVSAEEDGEILYWVAPMDPNYQRDKSGKSPMGMDLIPVYDTGDAGSSTVTISPEVIQNLGVRTTQAEVSRLWRGIDTVGYVDYDESKVSHIHLRTEGWIENLMVRSEGERVHKGDRLFDIYSPGLVNAQEEFVQALSSGNKGLMTASSERLDALGVSASQISQLRKSRKAKQYISIHAPQDGVVSELPVREGMFIKPATKIMSLADLSRVWLLAEVFERQAEWVREEHPAEVRVSYLPGRTWEGLVEYIYPSLDPKTRTLKVRLSFENPGEELKPNMYANVKIFGGPKDDVVVIPIEGLIRTGRNERVIISLGQGRFEARDVVAGIESGDYVEILQGVSDGDQIVTSGQFLIDSESSMRASLNRMSAKKSENSEMSTMKSTADLKVVSASGVIQAIMLEEHKLNLQHEAIESLGWPAMTMDFVVDSKIDINEFSVNDDVMFKLEQHDDRYRITSIQKMNKGEM